MANKEGVIGFAEFAHQWGIVRDLAVEELLTELKAWQKVSGDIRAEYDPGNREVRLRWPNDNHNLKPSNKSWRKFRDRFRDLSDKIAVYFEAKHLQTETLRVATREHLALLQHACRVFGGEIVATRKRESR